MAEYTPTTEQVELDFACLGGRSDEEDYDNRVPAFRRWLTVHDAAPREQIAREVEAAEEPLLSAEDMSRHKDYIVGRVNGLRHAVRIIREGVTK